MNSKNMAKSLKSVMDKWIKSINDENVVKLVKNNAMITGGAIVSLLNGETPNDYDIYFKDFTTAYEVTKYYVNLWNELHQDGLIAVVQVDDFFIVEHNNIGCFKYIDNHNYISEDKINRDTGRISVFIKSQGSISEPNESGIDDVTEPLDVIEPLAEEETDCADFKKIPYRPRYMSTNAISLTDKIQLIIRFYGPIEKIHENYDFVHCTCSYDYADNKINLPSDALECIINKELRYIGSKYPLCSIIRTRKFISRGWTINAGQYVKMAWQLNELNLKDLKVFKDQLVGVDSLYFNHAIEYMQLKMENDPNFVLTEPYLFEIIDRIF